MKKVNFFDETKFLIYCRHKKKSFFQNRLTTSTLGAFLFCITCYFLTPGPVFAGPDLSGSKSLSSPPAGTYAEINVSAWLYLEGAKIDPQNSDEYGLQMRTDLNELRILPGQCYTGLGGGVIYAPAGQPYSGAPWSYNGNEGDNFDSYGQPAQGAANYPATVVDWILVSLRESPDGMNVSRQAALLHSDGHVEFVGGGFHIDNTELKSAYFIVIEHRNHLIIMSPQAVPLDGNTLTYDFRYTQSFICSPYGICGNGQKELLPDQPGVYAMYASNGDQSQSPSSNKDINFQDRTFWEGHNMTSGHYCCGDYNMNGDCNYNDLILFELNNGKYSSVP
jgi:hypothetical protein